MLPNADIRPAYEVEKAKGTFRKKVIRYERRAIPTGMSVVQKEGEKGKVVLYTFEQKEPLRVSKWPYKAEGWPVQVLQFNELNDGLLGMADMDSFNSTI